MTQKHTAGAEPQDEKEFFLYPVIRVQAKDEAEATDKVFEAIFTAGVGEIPRWFPPPPTYEEKRLQQAAPELLAALEAVRAGARKMIADPSATLIKSGARFRMYLGCVFCGSPFPMTNQSFEEASHDRSCPMPQVRAAIAKAKGGVDG